MNGLAYEDWIIICHGWEVQEETATDVSAYTREEWDAHCLPIVQGLAAVGEDSGLVLNRARREVAALEAALDCR